MNTRLKENWKLNFIYHFILGPKMGKMVFDLDKGNFFFVSINFLLKKIQEDIPPAASSKDVKQIFV